MLKLDKNTVNEYETAGIEKLKVFMYEAGCSGKKVNMEVDFDLDDELERLDAGYSFDLYVPRVDKEHLEHASITRVVKADHTGVAKTRYIFTSEEVEDRCGCGTSFAFEKPVPKIDLEKLRLLRQNFKNKNL